MGDKKGAGGGQSAVMEGHGDCAQRRPRAPSYRGAAFTDARTHAPRETTLLCQLLTWEPGLWASAPAGHSALGRQDTMKSLLLNT